LHPERLTESAMLGAALGVLVMVVDLRLPRSRRALMFALLMAASAGIYLGAALGLHYTPAIVAETAAFLVFGIAAFAGARTPIVLGLVWPAHAIWDLIHYFEFVQTSLPRIYEVACFAADVVWGFMILGRIDLFLPGRSSHVPDIAPPRFPEDAGPPDAA